MRENFVRWGGAAAIFFAVLMVVRAIADMTVDANIYTDDAVDFLPAIEFHRSGVLVSVLMMLLAPLAAVPAYFGIYHALREEQRPVGVLALTFLGLGMVLLVVAFSVYAMELQVSSEYLTSRDAIRAAVAQDGEVLIGIFILLQQVAYSAVGVGTIVLGGLALTSPIFPKWVGWITLVVGLLLFVFFAVAPAVPWIHAAWLGLVGWMMYDRAHKLTPPRGATAEARR